MTLDSAAFDDYLTVEESPVAEGSVTLFHETTWTPAAICVTDRRVFFLPEAGGFLDVPRRQVQSIQSRPTARRSGPAIGALLLAATGVALVAAAASLLVAGATRPVVPLLGLVAVAGAVGTARIVASGRALDADDASAVVDAVDDALQRAGSVDALGALRDVDAHRRYERRLGRVVAAYPLLQWAAALVGVAGAAGLVLLGAWTALGLAAAAALGVGLAAASREYVHDLEARGRRIHRRRAVSLQLVDGRVVRFRVDADATIDRDLSRLTARGPPARHRREEVAAVEEPGTEQGASTGP